MSWKRIGILLRDTWRGFGAHNCSQMAAAISYHVLFAVAPLTMFSVALLGMFAGTEHVQERITEQAIDYLRVDSNVEVLLSDDGRVRIEQQFGGDAVLHIDEDLTTLNQSDESSDQRKTVAEDLDAGKTVTIAGYQLTKDDLIVRADNLVTDAIRNVIDASRPIGIVSFVVLAYAASGVFGTVRRSLDAVWEVRERRPLVQGKLVDLAMLCVLLLLLAIFALSIATSAALRALRATLNDPLLSLPFEEGILWWVLGIGLSGMFSFLFCVLAYRYGPSVSHSFRDVWPGAIVTTAGFELLKQGYGVYIDNFGSFDVVYGALGGVLLFMFFVNLAAMIFLFGAEIAARYPQTIAVTPSYLSASSDPPKAIQHHLLDTIRGLFVRR